MMLISVGASPFMKLISVCASLITVLNTEVAFVH